MEPPQVTPGSSGIPTERASASRSHRGTVEEGASVSSRGRRAELAVQVALHEYDALRAEILDLQRRTNQMMALAIGGAGAVLSAGVLGPLGAKPLELTYLFYAAAGLLGLVTVAVLGHANKQVEIGVYLRKQATELRLELQAVDTGFVDPSWLMAWEDRSVGSLAVTSPATAPVKSTNLLIADAMQMFEVVALVAIPLALLASGWLVSRDIPSTEVQYTSALLGADIGVAVLAFLTVPVSLLLGSHRDDTGRRNAVLARSVRWRGGPWEGDARLTEIASQKAGADFVARWAKEDAPPSIVPLPGGNYVRLERKGDDGVWQYDWRPNEEIKNGGW